ncbi:hypothetical protein GCK32_013759, partial [Trichostrongylus colubriformis]
QAENKMAAVVELLPPPADIRHMMSFTYLILSIIGIIPNIILAITLIKIYEGSPAIWVYNVVNFLDTVGYNGVLDFTFVMAVNRLTVFLMPRLHYFLFDSSNIKRLHMRYQSYTFPILMFITYIVLFFYIKTRLKGAAQNKSVAQRQRKYEINLVVQAVIIAFFIELQTLSFTVLPMIGSNSSGNNRFYLSLTQNIISIMNNSSSPYVYFFYNSQIRAGMLALVRCQSPKAHSQAVVTTVTQSHAGRQDSTTK